MSELPNIRERLQASTDEHYREDVGYLLYVLEQAAAQLEEQDQLLRMRFADRNTLFRKDADGDLVTMEAAPRKKGMLS